MAVQDVSLAVARGEVVGLLGPNGSGKSTLIRMLATLLIPDTGCIRVFGHDVVNETMAVRQLLNRVSVEASFFKKLSPMENLAYAARLYGLSGEEGCRRAGEILARLGMKAERLDGPLEELSRGMQQKIAIARAMLTEPPLLLLDEPTTGLDPVSKHEVQRFVQEVLRARGTTLVLSTHDMAEADALCDRIAILHEGRIVAMGAAAALKAQVATNGEQPTLEEVFFRLTGNALVAGKEVDTVKVA
jgi:ABC-2 type transport system ATP-binding protein